MLKAFGGGVEFFIGVADEPVQGGVKGFSHFGGHIVTRSSLRPSCSSCTGNTGLPTGSPEGFLGSAWAV